MFVCVPAYSKCLNSSTWSFRIWKSCLNMEPFVSLHPYLYGLWFYGLLLHPFFLLASQMPYSKCYWRHLACSTFLHWIFQMFLYTDLCPPNYLAISIKNCFMHLTISRCDWIVKNEDLNQWTYWWFLKMACVLYRCLDFDADWGETIPYEGRYGLNHFSTIY